MELQGADRLLAACAMQRKERFRAIAAAEPETVAAVLAQGGKLLATFAGTGNTEGLRLLLDLGLTVDALFEGGDGYWDIARNSTALSVAAWRARHDTVKLLLARGAVVDAKDAGGTPLMLAVRACVDSYWRDLRSPESVASLLQAGASASGVPYPCGYDKVDEMAPPQVSKRTLLLFDISWALT